MLPIASVPHPQNDALVDNLPVLDEALLPAEFSVRSATISDVNGMSALINEFASARIMLARGPLYLYQSIQDYRVISVPGNLANDPKETVVACVGLHVLWEDLAEVRSLAVHPTLQGRGLGRIMVQELINNARRLGVRQLFTFTLAAGFFEKLGFKAINRENIPPVVWAECSKCPKFYKCDEVGMMLNL